MARFMPNSLLSYRVRKRGWRHATGHAPRPLGTHSGTQLPKMGTQSGTHRKSRIIIFGFIAYDQRHQKNFRNPYQGPLAQGAILASERPTFTAHYSQTTKLKPLEQGLYLALRSADCKAKSPETTKTPTQGTKLRIHQLCSIMPSP